MTVCIYIDIYTLQLCIIYEPVFVVAPNICLPCYLQYVSWLSQCSDYNMGWMTRESHLDFLGWGGCRFFS